MRMRLLVWLATFLILTGSRAVAEDDVQAIVQKAIGAHGGAEKLTKYKANTTKMKGKLKFDNNELEFTVESASLMPDKTRNQIKIDLGGMEASVLQVYDGKKAWTSTMGQVMEMDDDQVLEMKHSVRDDYLATLVPLLKDKSLKVVAAGEIKVDGKPAAGIKVTAEGFKEVKMYFSKETGLLVNMERRSQDPAMAEVDAETFYSNYKDINGLKQPMSITVKHDGKAFLEAEVTELKLLEKIDEALFKKPE